MTVDDESVGGTGSSQLAQHQLVEVDGHTYGSCRRVGGPGQGEGLRSSWDASATKRRWRRSEAASRSSISCMVRARRPTSSLTAGSGTLRSKAREEMRATSDRMAST